MSLPPPHFSGKPVPERILGIDPGLHRTGYAVLDRSSSGPVLREGGIVRSTVALSLAERVYEISTGLKEVLEQYQPGVMAIEQVFSTGRYPKSALLMAHARGTILVAAAECRMTITHYTPTQIKKLLTGNGRASKEQIQRALQSELRMEQPLEPNDVADALAVALCHYYSTGSRHRAEQIRSLRTENSSP